MNRPLSEQHLTEIRERHIRDVGNTSILVRQDVGDLLEEVHRCRSELNRVRADAEYLSEHLGNAAAFLARRER